MRYEPVIGLEVHVQLLTASKMFCRCPNRFGQPPNTLVCPVCLGYPGALPVVNHRAIDLAVGLALALGCTVRERSAFARKSYFYPDLPKGYQISQLDRPLAGDGALPLSRSGKRVGIERLHLEEDAGKIVHPATGPAAGRETGAAPGGAPAGSSLLDFNRSGVPLVEIVSRPEMSSAEEAHDYLSTLRRVLLYTGASDGSMEEGSLRCDVNVSLRPAGESRLGTKVEVKNVNSFRHVARAIGHEVERQRTLLEAGGRVVAETRGFDVATSTTLLLRGKEGAQDYRYFPEPDLPPLVLDGERIAALRARLPELPWARQARLVEHLGIPPDDARVLTGSRSSPTTSRPPWRRSRRRRGRSPTGSSARGSTSCQEPRPRAGGAPLGAPPRAARGPRRRGRGGAPLGLRRQGGVRRRLRDGRGARRGDRPPRPGTGARRGDDRPLGRRGPLRSSRAGGRLQGGQDSPPRLPRRTGHAALGRAGRPDRGPAAARRGVGGRDGDAGAGRLTARAAAAEDLIR